MALTNKHARSISSLSRIFLSRIPLRSALGNTSPLPLRPSALRRPSRLLDALSLLEEPQPAYNAPPAPTASSSPPRPARTPAAARQAAQSTRWRRGTASTCYFSPNPTSLMPVVSRSVNSASSSRCESSSGGTALTTASIASPATSSSFRSPRFLCGSE